LTPPVNRGALGENTDFMEGRLRGFFWVVGLSAGPLLPSAAAAQPAGGALAPGQCRAVVTDTAATLSAGVEDRRLWVRNGPSTHWAGESEYVFEVVWVGPGRAAPRLSAEAILRRDKDSDPPSSHTLPELLRLASLEVWSSRLPWPTGYGFPIERDPALYVWADGPTVVLTLRGGTAVRHYFVSRPDTAEFFVRLADSAAYNCRAPVHYVGF
jgi:hypothetical protein